jgi:hypothetical protein
VVIAFLFVDSATQPAFGLIVQHVKERLAGFVAKLGDVKVPSLDKDGKPWKVHGGVVRTAGKNPQQQNSNRSHATSGATPPFQIASNGEII